MRLTELDAANVLGSTLTTCRQPRRAQNEDSDSDSDSDSEMGAPWSLERRRERGRKQWGVRPTTWVDDLGSPPSSSWGFVGKSFLKSPFFSHLELK